MKKIAFAVQVFGLIALFPIYVMSEMNHGTGKLPGNKNHPVIKEEVKKIVLRASLNPEAQNQRPVRLKYVWIQDLQLERMK